MNYIKIYNEIINKAKLEDRRKSKEIYFEDHHILPKCLGGSNEKENRVLLTAKEHYICHKLLTYIYRGNRKIACAFHKMTYGNTGNHIKSSRDYLYARELIKFTPISKETREKLRIAFTGERNPQYGKTGFALGSKRNNETKQRLSESKMGEKNPQHGKPGFALGSKRTEESLKKISIAQKKRFKDKKNHPRYGEKMSEETKRKISNSLKKKFSEKNTHIIRESSL